MAYKVPHRRAKNQPAFRLIYKDHTGRRREKVFHGTARQADRALAELQHQADMISFGMQPKIETRLIWKDAKQEYFDYLYSERRSQATIDRYARSLKAFEKFAGENIRLSMIDTRTLIRFKIKRSRTCTHTGVAIDLRHIKAFLRYCYMMNYIATDPFRGFKINEYHKPVRFLSEDEITTILSDTDQKTWDLIVFYLNTGARANEILPPNFTWDNITDSEIKLIGKRNKTRYIPITNTIRSILDRRRDLPYPFPYTYDEVYHCIVRRAFKNIPNANIHTLRKTTGALMLRQGIDIYYISKFLGHSSVTVTEKHYIDLLRSDYINPSNKLSAIIDVISK